MAEFNEGAWMTVEKMKKMDAERDLTPEEKIINVVEKTEQMDKVFDAAFDINPENIDDQAYNIKEIKQGVKKEIGKKSFDDLDEEQKNKLIEAMAGMLGLI